MLLLQQNLAAAPATLTNRWSLDAAHVSGAALTADVGSITGTLSSTTGITADASGGLHFDGLSDIALSACPLPASMGAHSTAFWFKNDDFTYTDGSTPSALGWFQSTGNTARVVVEGSGSSVNISISIFKGGSQVTPVVDKISAITTTGTEHHVAYTFNGASTIQIYVDGVLQTSLFDNTSAAFSQPAANALGAKTSGANARMKGALRKVEVYSGVLTATEVAALAAAGVTGSWTSTETADAFAGSALAGAFGTMPAVENQDSFATTGSGVFGTGTWASTEAPDTLAASGSAGNNGTWASTEATDVLAVTGGDVASVGSWNSPGAVDTFATTGGQVISSGPWASTESPDTMAAQILAAAFGPWASLEAADAFSASGSLAGVVVTGSAMQLLRRKHRR